MRKGVKMECLPPPVCLEVPPNKVLYNDDLAYVIFIYYIYKKIIYDY